MDTTSVYMPARTGGKSLTMQRLQRMAALMTGASDAAFPQELPLEMQLAFNPPAISANPFHRERRVSKHAKARLQRAKARYSMSAKRKRLYGWL